MDPILQCDACSAKMFVEKIMEVGHCGKCGNRKFVSVKFFSEEEWKNLQKVASEGNEELKTFMELFEGVEEVDDEI